MQPLRRFVIALIGFLSLSIPSNQLKSATETDSAASAFTFVLEHTYPDLGLPTYPAWSPTEDILVAKGQGGLYLIDFKHPHPEPKLLVEGRVTSADWSPDGRFLAVRLQSFEEARSGQATLAVVNVATKGKQHLARASRFYEFAWAPNGEVVTWAGKTPPTRFKPSGVGRPASPGRSRRLHLRVVSKGGGKFALVRLTGDGDHERLLPKVGTIPLAIRDFFPDGKHALAWAATPEWRTVILDSLGSETSELAKEGGQDGFTGTTVTSDGRGVLGFHEVDVGDRISGATVLAIDLTTGRQTKVEGASPGLWPQASRLSDRVAFKALSGGIHVGRLRQVPR